MTMLQVERQVRLEHDGAGRHVDLAEAQPDEQRLVGVPRGEQARHVDRGAADVQLLARAHAVARDARGDAAGGEHLVRVWLRVRFTVRVRVRARASWAS